MRRLILLAGFALLLLVALGRAWGQLTTPQVEQQGVPWTISHLSSVTHIAAASPLPVVLSPQQGPWAVTAHAGTGSLTVNQGGAWTVQAHQAGRWLVDHVSSVTHVAGTVSLVSQAGFYATLSGGNLNVAASSGQSGTWTIQALHQAVVSHVSSVTHVQAAGPLPVVASPQGSPWQVVVHQATQASGRWLLDHVTSVVHVSAAGTPWAVNMALAVRCVNTGATAFEACGGAGGGADAVNVFHQSTIRHISSVTHVGGTVSLVNQAGTYATLSGTALNVASSAGQSGSWTIQALHQAVVSHISSVVHIAAAGAPWPVSMALATRCVNTGGTAFEACGGAGSSDTVNVFHQSTIRHISSVTHVGGTLSLVDQAGTYATFLGTQLRTAAAAYQSGIWTLQAAHQVVVSHVSSVTHVGGTVSLVNRAGTYVTLTGSSLDVNLTTATIAATQSGTWTMQPGNTPNTAAWLVNVQHISSVTHIAGAVQLLGNVSHVQSAMAHVIGTVTVEGRGTAGAPVGGVVSVQGVASGTAVPVSATQSGTWTAQPGNTPNTAAWLVQIQHASALSHVAVTRYGSTGVPACLGRTKVWVGINQTANAQLITGVAGQRVYICSFNVVTATAQNLAVVAGTGTTCATATVGVPGLTGGATAATGWNIAANGGLTFGTGNGDLAQTTVNGNNVCLLQSGAGQVSGGLSYATQ